MPRAARLPPPRVTRRLPPWVMSLLGLIAIVPIAMLVAAGTTVVRVPTAVRPVAATAIDTRAASPTSSPSGADRSGPASGPARTSVATSSPLPPPRPTELTMAFSGDILVHQRLWETAAAHAEPGEAFDFRPMFAPLRPILAAADLALCHLETPLSPDNGAIASYPVFETPHQLADAIAWAGYDGCSTASNHSLDGGVEGVAATLRWLDEAGLGHAGTARTERESRRITTYRAQGADVAHLSYTWGYNGFTPDHPWRANRIEVRQVLADAAAARAGGADLVIVSLHWGVEYTHQPTTWQHEVADRLTRSPHIDLLVGHHAHVVQPLHRLNGTWVAYGLGNILSGMTSSLGTPAVQDGVVLLATARRTGEDWRVADVSFVPTRVEYGTWRVLPIARTLRLGGPSDGLRAELATSWSRTVAAMRLLGDDVSPVGRPLPR
jgi:hypothetical protein